MASAPISSRRFGCVLGPAFRGGRRQILDRGFVREGWSAGPEWYPAIKPNVAPTAFVNAERVRSDTLIVGSKQARSTRRDR